MSDIIVSRVFDVPVEHAWNAWIDPELVKRWWGPAGFTAPYAHMDFREGGTSIVCMRSPDGQDHYNSWAYRKIVPLQEFDFIQNLVDKEGNPIDPSTQGLPPDFPQDSRSTVVFQTLTDNHTKVIVTEYDWAEGQMRTFSEIGLNQCLDKMGESLK